MDPDGHAEGAGFARRGEHGAALSHISRERDTAKNSAPRQVERDRTGGSDGKSKWLAARHSPKTIGRARGQISRQTIGKAGRDESEREDAIAGAMHIGRITRDHAGDFREGVE